MPLLINCSNTFCRGYTDRLGGLCQACQKKADEQKAQNWKYEGWSRYDERSDIKNHKKGGTK